MDKPAGFRVVVIGSSTAAGTGADPIDKAWVNLYRDYLEKANPRNEVINLAQGGYQTFLLMPSGNKPAPARPRPDPLRNITKALSLRPDAIIVNLPSNDAAAGFSAAEQLANFDTIVETSLRAGVPIWICTTQPRNLPEAQVAVQTTARDTIRSRYSNFCLEFWDGLATPEGWMEPRYNSGDGIHLNNAGHRLLFERVCHKNILLGLVPRTDRKTFAQSLAAWFRRQRDAVFRVVGGVRLR